MRRRTRALSPLLFVTLAACGAAEEPASSGATAAGAGPGDAGPPASGAASAPPIRPPRVDEVARVALADLANGASRLEDPRTGVAAEVALPAAAPRAATRDAAGELRFAAALGGGGAIRLRRTRAGFEDFVELPSAPPGDELRYELAPRGAAGLRLVGDVLELLDAQGAPRVRMQRPWIADRNGARRFAQVDVEGCAVDRSPAAPWGRPTTPPGAARCTVVIRWDGADLRYPAVLDPSWTETSSAMTSPRASHTATLLANTRVLLVGGEYPAGPGVTTRVASAELFDPVTNTFAATGSLSSARARHAAVRLNTGDVLVAGGRGGADTLLTTTEIYDVGSGTFRAGGALGTAREYAEAARLLDGSVLLAGGLGETQGVLDTVERMGALTETWAAAAPMLYRRWGHFLTVLRTGQALVVGGTTTLSIGDLPFAEVFPPSSGAWTSTGTLATPRYHFAGAALSDGRLLVAGGYSRGVSATIGSTEVFDPQTGTWSGTGALAERRMFHTLTALPGGAALAVGGATFQGATTLDAYATGAELWDPDTGSFAPAGTLTQPRIRHQATALLDGRVLVTGGTGPLGGLDSAELFELDAVGAACTTGRTCATGFCVDGVCCDAACTGECQACAGAETGAADGACAPVLAGRDPHADCPDDGAPTCARDGTCDGASGCRYYPSAACTPRPCATGSDCASGSCADGICCDRACTGTCEACTATLKGSGADGLCDAIAAGTDPEDECSSGGSGSCAGEGSCDGAGSCELSTTGAVCAAAACSGPSTLSLSATCDSAGVCAPTEIDCAPYGCDAATVACRVRCATSSDCAPGATCAGGVCERAGAGSPCSAGSDCDSGYCVDGVCCSTYCDGQCEACDLPGQEGTCEVVTGAPRGTRSPCRGSGVCAGTCDGTVRSACAYPTETTPCGSSASCEDGVERADSCNGVGDCSLGATRSCAPFACDGTRCASTCSTDDDCAASYRCDSSGSCVDENAPFCNELGSVEYPSGQTERCAPFGCENGACRTRCSSDDDCHSSAHCSERTEECLFSSDDSGCGCRAAGGGAAPGRPAALAALLVGLLAARRAPRRGLRRDR